MNSIISYKYDEQFFEEAKCLYLAIDTQKSFFNDPVFWEACHSIFSKHSKIAYIRICEKGTPRAFAVFRLANLKLMGRNLKCWVPITYRVGEFTQFIVSNKDHQETTPALIASFETLDCDVFIPHLREADTQILSKSWKNRHAYSSLTAPFCSNEGGKFSEILSKKKLRYFTNRYNRQGKIQVENATNNKGCEELMPLFNMHVERWAMEGVTSKFTDPIMRDVFDAISKKPAFSVPSNKFVCSTVKLNGRLIAGHLGYIWDKTILYYLPVMNIAEFDQSPGQVMIRELFSFAHQNQFDRFHLGTGNERYKNRYATGSELFQSYLISKKYSTFALHKLKKLLPQDALERPQALLKSQKLMLHRIKRAVFPNVIDVFIDESTSASLEKTNSKELSYLSFRDYVELTRQLEERPYEINRQIQQRFKNGYQLVALKDKNKFRCFAWLRKSESQTVGEIGNSLSVNRPALWIIDCVTLPESRGQGYYKLLLNSIKNKHSESPKIIYASPKNIPSTAAIKSVGFNHWLTLKPNSLTISEGADFELSATIK